MSNVPKPLLIGWKEFVDFPEWKVRRVKVKVDTGARTSALDVPSYDLVEDPELGTVAVLRLALHRRRPERVFEVRTPVRGMTVVTSSTGESQERPVVETTVRIGPVTKRLRLTITNRSTMLFRMILGRTALEGDFIVDVGRKYLLRRRPASDGKSS